MPTLKLTKTAIETHPLPPKGAPGIELYDTVQRGLICKITPGGERVFLVNYRTKDGTKRKPRIGAFGQITLDQARDIAKKWLGRVANGEDPSVERQQDRQGATVKALCEEYLSKVAEAHSKPSYLKQQRRMVETKIIPEIGTMKVAAISFDDINKLHQKMNATPYEANRVLALLSVIFKYAESTKRRSDGSNPCRLVKRYRERRRERLLTDAEVSRIHEALRAAEEARTEGQSAILAIRLLFATACRAGEILGLQWGYINEERGEIVWPDSKTGSMSKPLTSEVREILKGAEQVVGSPWVCPALLDKTEPLSINTLEKVWRRILKAAEVPACGLHAIRHRTATEIANDPEIPIHVGMKLTGHKTVTTYLRYHHSQREQLIQAAEKIAERRRKTVRQGDNVVPLKASA